MAETEEELKSLLMRVKEVSSQLELNIQKNDHHGILSHHFMANRWGTVETVADFIFWGFKITADSDFSHEIKRHLLLEGKT